MKCVVGHVSVLCLHVFCAPLSMHPCIHPFLCTETVPAPGSGQGGWGDCHLATDPSGWWGSVARKLALSITGPVDLRFLLVSLLSPIVYSRIPTTLYTDAQ